MPRKYTIEINYDSDMGCPCEENDGEWQIYSFCKDHVRFKDPSELFDDETGKPKDDIAEKLKTGLAFFLSYYEHGNCLWSLAGTGPKCEWDSVQFAGIAIWEEPEENIGAKTYEERKKDCENALEQYTDWCNGECYYYRITDAKGKLIDCCTGYIGLEWAVQAAREALPDDADKRRCVVSGDAADAVRSYHMKDLFPKKKPKIKTPTC